MRTVPSISRCPASPLAFSALLLISVVALTGCKSPSASADGGASEARPHVEAASAVEAGRYLAVVAGCNDCHTEGYLQAGGRVPEAEWLAGSGLGWRGPWGTTYAANLRLRVQQMSEDAWVHTLRSRHTNPPMPWMNVNQMSERDARALYRYIESMGPTGEPVPAYVPSGKEPATPFVSLEPQNVGPSEPS